MNPKRKLSSFFRPLLSALLLAALLQESSTPARAATQIDIHGPSGSGEFGKSVSVLPNGNIVVTDPAYDGGIGVNAGAVYLYNGSNGAQISMLTGGGVYDAVGSGGVTVLSNGNYVVSSPNWNNVGAGYAGAVTWGSATSGASGRVSAANSLVGSTGGDNVGYYGVTALSNGNYVVISPYWKNGSAALAGAVTWGNGVSGISGLVSAINSLVGSSVTDFVGEQGVIALSNGNYVVFSPRWDNGAAVDAGAVTWGSGASGIKGAVAASNSLVGSTAGDQVGYWGLWELSNGNYLVSSPYWGNGAAAAKAGAVTWGNKASGVSGVLSAANSLVGSTAGDQVGYSGIYELSNDNYLVVSKKWSNGAAADAGAATWGSATSGVSGAISAANSLVGSTAGDQVGYRIFSLSNSNYVVGSPYWDNGAAVDAGAVTWGSGASGVSGAVSAANSLVGSTAGDQVSGVAKLSNGNYVVTSPYWDNGITADAGAATWGSGASGVSGAVSAANSLVGSTAGDQVGYRMVSLSNSNYVVGSPYWDNGAAADAGAVTWGSGASGIKGAVAASNSLVGSTADNHVGYIVVPLSNSNYVVGSPYWDNGAAADAGAVTWGNGVDGISGPVSAANSLVGSTAGDQVGYQVVSLSNSNYVVGSPYWDNGAAANAGAVTWGSGASGIKGAVAASNSLVGSTAGDQVGYRINELDNGNYVVRSPSWDNGITADAGAATWGSATSGVSGLVSAANSLVGSSSGDQVGSDGLFMLTNGNYLVYSPTWDNGTVQDAGAATWGSGASGVSGLVSAANSLVGRTAGDQVGSGGVTTISNGSYTIWSPMWDNGPITDAGAVTWGFGTSGVSGPINTINSVLGEAAGGGNRMVTQYNPVLRQLVVGRPAENIVTLFRLPYMFLPVVRR